jgi:class 3 adenylate cyclase
MVRYFDVARVAVERHGGTVEKFIGDAAARRRAEPSGTTLVLRRVPGSTSGTWLMGAWCQPGLQFNQV